MCPGNFSTSGTIIVFLCNHVLPHTPSPFLILKHATGPWKGPSISSSPFTI